MPRGDPDSEPKAFARNTFYCKPAVPVKLPFDVLSVTWLLELVIGIRKQAGAAFAWTPTALADLTKPPTVAFAALQLVFI